MSFNVVRTDPIISIGAKLGTATGTVIYTAPRPALPVIDSINLANSTGANVVATITWYDASTTTAYTIFSGPVPLTGRLAIADIAIQLREGDQIRASAASAPAIDMIMTFTEPTGASR